MGKGSVSSRKVDEKPKPEKRERTALGKRRLEWGAMCPALIVAHVRSGGTFLAHCLSTHPAVFCPRSEPLAQVHSPWYRHFPCANPLAILQAIWEQPGYEVTACRVTARQLNQKILAACANRQVRVIHLTRNDVIATAVSDIINRMYWHEGIIKNYAVHTFKPLDAPHAVIDPAHVIRRGEQILKEQGRIAAALARYNLNVLPLTYADIVGGENAEANELPRAARDTLCEFLGISHLPMSAAGLRKVNNRPLSETVANWDEVVAACKQAGLLEGKNA